MHKLYVEIGEAALEALFYRAGLGAVLQGHKQDHPTVWDIMLEQVGRAAFEAMPKDDVLG